MVNRYIYLALYIAITPFPLLGEFFPICHYELQILTLITATGSLGKGVEPYSTSFYLTKHWYPGSTLITV